MPPGLLTSHDRAPGEYYTQQIGLGLLNFILIYHCAHANKTNIDVLRNAL